jgi:uncharacterized protein (UPF0548 family)
LHKAALERWSQFRLGWAEAYPSDTHICTGEMVALISLPIGLWSLNACRIVYIVDELVPVRRFGFAYGTLPDHAMTGEERFLVEWDQASGEVCCDILAFSRPHQLMSRLGYWYVHRVQKRFGRESAAAMVRATRGGCASWDADRPQPRVCRSTMKRLVDIAGFRLELVSEPRPTDELV